MVWRTAAHLAALTAFASSCYETSGTHSSGDETSMGSDAEPTGQTGDGTSTPGDLEAWPPMGLSAVEGRHNVLAYEVTWLTRGPAPTRLEVDCGEAYRQSFRADAWVESHRVWVLGLLAGTSCLATAWDDRGDAPQATSVAFSVAQLPDYLPRMQAEVIDAAAIEPGWTLTNLTQQLDELSPPGAGLFDEQGRYRWYHRRTEATVGSDSDLRIVDEGVLMGGSGFLRSSIIGWDGQLRWQANFPSDHHIEQWGGAGRYLYLSESNVGCPDGVFGGGITWYDRFADEVLGHWGVCEHYEPPVYDRYFAHPNGIAVLPDQSAMLLSTRNQSLVFKFAIDQVRIDDGRAMPQMGELEWKLGYLGDFALTNDRWFAFQHAPEPQPDGHILLFDNGRGSKGLQMCTELESCPADAELRLWSRAVELELDETTMEATVVWQYRPDPDLFAEIWGDADRLPNGNTLVTFGQRDPELSSTIVEIDRDGREVWRLTSPLSWSWYRAQRVAPMFGVVGG